MSCYFTLFYCFSDLSCGECDVIYTYFMCCSVNGSVVVVVYPLPWPLLVGGSPMFPLVVHQPASPSIWPAVQSLRRGLSTNPGATMWCVCVLPA